MMLLTLCGAFALITVFLTLAQDWLPMPARTYKLVDRTADALFYATWVSCALGLLVIL